jgi:hypothetical protein
MVPALTFWIACARVSPPAPQNLPGRRGLPSAPTPTARGRQADPFVGLLGDSVRARGTSAWGCCGICWISSGLVNRRIGESATGSTVRRGRSGVFRGDSAALRRCFCGPRAGAEGGFGRRTHGGLGAARGAGGADGGAGHLKQPRAARRGPAAAGRARAAAR